MTLRSYCMMQPHKDEKGVLLSSFDAYMQEVPTLLSLPQGPVGSPIWLIMTGGTTGIQGYNRLISRIVPLTAAARSVDLIPFMVVISLRLRCQSCLRFVNHDAYLWLSEDNLLQGAFIGAAAITSLHKKSCHSTHWHNRRALPPLSPLWGHISDKRVMCCAS